MLLGLWPSLRDQGLGETLEVISDEAPSADPCALSDAIMRPSTCVHLLHKAHECQSGHRLHGFHTHVQCVFIFPF